MHSSDCERWRELCFRVQAGDSCALETLQTETRPWLCKAARAYRQQLQDSDVEEMVHETILGFLRILQRRGIDDRGPCGLLLLILRRAINRLAERQNRDRKTVAIGPADDTGDTGDVGGFDPEDKELLTPAQEACWKETIEAVRECIQSLPEKQRVAIHLRYYEGMSYKEAAEALGVTRVTFKNLLQRAFRTLRECRVLLKLVPD